MIRSFEKTHPPSILSARAASNGRVPIFAVSASLVERDRQKYVDGGFDAWILKPIDFKRLNNLLAGIEDEAKRDEALYRSGQWEGGGWFVRRQPDVFAAATTPDDAAPVTEPPPGYRGPRDEDGDNPISKEQHRLDRLVDGMVLGPKSKPAEDDGSSAAEDVQS